MIESQAPGHANDPVIRPLRGALKCAGMPDRVMVMGGAFTMWDSRQAWEQARDADWDEIVPPPAAEGAGVVAVRLGSDGMTTQHGEPLILQEPDDIPFNGRWQVCALEGNEFAFAYSAGESEVRMRFLSVDPDTLAISTLQDIQVMSLVEYPEWADEMPWGDTPFVEPTGGMGLCHLGAGMVVLATKLTAMLPNSHFPVHPDYPPQEHSWWAPAMIPVWRSGSGWVAGDHQILYIPPAGISEGSSDYGESIHAIDHRRACLVFAGEGGAGVAVVAQADRSTQTLTIGPRNKFCWGLDDWFLTHPDPPPDNWNERGPYVIEREGIDVTFTNGSSCLVRGGILAIGNEAVNAGALGIPHFPVTLMRLLKVRGFEVEKVDVRPIGEWANYVCAPLAGGRAVVSSDMPPDMNNPYARTLPAWTDGIGGYAEVVGVADGRLKVLFGLGQGMSCLSGGPVPT